MKRVLVVDDEAIQRRVLAQMIREVVPSCEVFEATNGKDALEKMSSHLVDVVFTDIKMPIMSGFDFIEHLNQSFHRVKVIILSGFRDFEYAQRAIRLGAFDYLLKPVSVKSIVEILNKVQPRITEEKASDEKLSAYFNHLLRDWITQGLSAEKFQELKEHFSIGQTGTVLVSKIVNGERLFESEESKDGLKDMVIERLDISTRSAGISVTFFREDLSQFITVITHERPLADTTVSLLSKLQHFCKQIHDDCGISLIVGVGRDYKDLFSEARQSYKEAVEAVSFHYYLTGNRVISYAVVSGMIRQMPLDLQKVEETLKECMVRLQSETIISMVNELINTILEGGFPYPDKWVQAFIRMFYGIAPVVKDFVSANEYKNMLIEAENRFTQSANVLEFKEQLLKSLWNLTEIVKRSRSDQHNTVIQACIDFIDSHYMDDLSLDTISAQLFFSPNYVSTMFKKHLGTTFCKYLANARINKAVELLKNREMRVYEIASMVGFKDDKYFYRVFKRRFGLTPDEYRRNYFLSNKE